MLYDDVKNVPKGAILSKGEAIVRKAKIKNISYKIQEPTSKPVIGRFLCDTVKTFCTIILEVEGMPKLEKNVETDPISHVTTFNDTVDELSVNGDTENVMVQGVSVCYDKDKYNEDFEKEDAYADALNKIMQLKIELVAIDGTEDVDDLLKDEEGNIIFAEYPEPKVNNTINVAKTPETPIEP